MGKNKIWAWWNDELYGDYQEYERNLPSNILEEYGKRLEEDTDNLLTYDVIHEIQHDATLNSKVKFSVIVENSDKIKKQDHPYSTAFCNYLPYVVPIFEVTYPFDKLYPCQFHSLITENKYTPSSVDDFKKLLELEIKDDKTAKKLGSILYYFYDVETIEKSLDEK